MNGRYDLDEGQTLEFLVHALFVFIAGCIAFLFHYAVAFALIAMAAALVAVRSGVEIDVAARRIRIYKAFRKWKLGCRWVYLDEQEYEELRYTNEAVVMNNKSASTHVITRTYDLYFVDTVGRSRLFHEFCKYPLARRTLDLLAHAFDMPSKDEYREIRQKISRRVPARR